MRGLGDLVVAEGGGNALAPRAEPMYESMAV